MENNNKLMLQAGIVLHGIYRIESVLGQGSFGVTYLAEHVYLEKKVAIKEFFMKEVNSRGEDGSVTGMTDGSLSYNYCRKFQKEATNLSQLDNPNIVRVTDMFAENGTFYYVMDYIEGQNLNDYVKTHHVGIDEGISIIKDVADALIYMHEKKHMLHLDLKPGNVMRRDSDGQIFLIDFGLSKHYSNEGRPETSTSIGLGTIGYAPIEQGDMTKDGKFRPTIDIYALGATFYKLLIGNTPPAAAILVTDNDLLEKHLASNNIPRKLANVVIKAMCPNVKKRFQSVSDFKDALCTFGNSVIPEAAKVPQSPSVDEMDANSDSDETEIASSVDGNELHSNSHTTNDGTIGNSNDEEENDSSSKKKYLIGFAVALFVGIAIVLFSQGNKTSESGVATMTSDDTMPIDSTSIGTATASPVQKESTCKSQQKESISQSEKNKDKKRDNSQEIKDDKASSLKKALARGNYKKVRQLANEGYSAAYAPLAKYYLRNNEYSLAETYARKARSAGYKEGKAVINALESLGYYD